VVPAGWLLLRAGGRRLAWMWAAFGVAACYAAAPLGAAPLLVFTAGLLALSQLPAGEGRASTIRPGASEL